MAKNQTGRDQKICDHEMVHFLCDGKNNFRACVKCKKSWPRPHPLLSPEEVLAVIEFGKFVAEEARKKGKRNPHKQKPKPVRDVDLL